MSRRCRISCGAKRTSSYVGQTIRRTGSTEVKKGQRKKRSKVVSFSSWNEFSVGSVFILMILLWVTKDFSGTPGWEIIFREKYISDGTVAILCGILPLILPNKNPFAKNWTYEPIIRWNHLAKHMPWGALILLGAGLAVASAFQVDDEKETRFSFYLRCFLGVTIIRECCSSTSISRRNSSCSRDSFNYYDQWPFY